MDKELVSNKYPKFKITVDPMLVVGDIMSTAPFCVTPEEELQSTEEIIKWKSIRHVPVINKDNELVGLVTHRDILKAMAKYGDKFIKENQQKVQIQDIMSTNLSTVVRTFPLKDAAKIMFDSKLGCLPVVEGKYLVGIITESDFISLFIP